MSNNMSKEEVFDRVYRKKNSPTPIWPFSWPSPPQFKQMDPWIGRMMIPGCDAFPLPNYDIYNPLMEVGLSASSFPLIWNFQSLFVP